MIQPDAWLASSLRVTAFPVDPIRIDGLSWWVDVVGYPPETQTIQPRVGQRREEGEYEGRKLGLRVRPDRIDWILSPAVKAPDEFLEGLPLIGPFAEALTTLVKLAEQWLPLCPPMARLAFGGDMIQRMDDKRAGYAQLAHYLPSVSLDPDSSDFLYQINRPRPSRVAGLDGLRINRLSKWSVVVVKYVSFAVANEAVTATAPEALESACRLEVDVNTDPNYRHTPFPSTKLPEIFRELVQTAEEIAARGDIP